MTQIIEIIKKRNKISLNGRSLTSFSDWCKHCNMLDMWFFFSFCFSAQWLLFFWACFFFFFPCFCCLEVSPIATCYHFLFTDTHGFEVEGKNIVIQWKRAWQRYQHHPSFNPIFWFSANIICTCSVSCRVRGIIFLPECKFSSCCYVCNLLKHGCLWFFVLNYFQNIEKLLKPSLMQGTFLCLLHALIASLLATNKPTHE